MDCVETSLLRKAGLRREMVMLSTAGHHQQENAFSAFPPEEEEGYEPADRSGVLWENFSVDDLLDLGSGVEHSCGEEEDLFGSEDAAEEEEEAEREDTHNSSSNSTPSALSFQVFPPSSDLVVPVGDAAELEWVSRFVDDSYSEFLSSSLTVPFNHHLKAPALPAANAKGEPSMARSTSSRTPQKRKWGSYCFFTDSLVVPSKARSKRFRSGGRVWSLRHLPLLAESSSSSCSSASSAASCSVSTSSSIRPVLLYDSFAGGHTAQLQRQQAQLRTKKKRGRKPKALAGAAPAVDGSASVEPQLRRRCSHCGVDKTPQWRAGPMGAKTLCNACGVRYKSGRLLPEYRPACSPTFLSHVHSNSHRKVIEMRRNKELAAAAIAVSASASCSATPPAQMPATAAHLYGGA